MAPSGETDAIGVMLSGQGKRALIPVRDLRNAIADKVRPDFEVKKMLSSAEHIGELPGACWSPRAARVPAGPGQLP